MRFTLITVAAIVGLVAALPTPPTTDAPDVSLRVANLTPKTNGDSDQGSGESGKDSVPIDSSFMGLGLGNTIDLGDLEHLPKVTTDLLLGSTQVFNGQENESLPDLPHD